MCSGMIEILTGLVLVECDTWDLEQSDWVISPVDAVGTDKTSLLFVEKRLAVSTFASVFVNHMTVNNVGRKKERKTKKEELNG